MDNIQDNHHSREALARDPNTQISLQYPGQDEVGPVHTAEPSPAAIIDARHDVEGGLKWVLGNFGNTTIVAIEPDTRGSKARWLDANSLADVIRWAKELNENRWNLYFCPNEPVPGLAKKPKGEEIALIRCAAFADIDAKDGRTLDDALAQVQRLPTPDLLIASGGGFQPIWMLPEPLPVTPEIIARVEARSKRVEDATGGDHVGNIDRILRLPFSMNYPNATKRAAGRVPCPSGLVILERLA